MSKEQATSSVLEAGGDNDDKNSEPFLQKMLQVFFFFHSYLPWYWFEYNKIATTLSYDQVDYMLEVHARVRKNLIRPRKFRSIFLESLLQKYSLRKSMIL